MSPGTRSRRTIHWSLDSSITSLVSKLMHTLHLIDAASPQARPAMLALLAATAREQARHGLATRVLLLGGASLGRAAEAGGLAGGRASGRTPAAGGRTRRVSVPMGRAELGVAAVHRALRVGGEPGVIYAWSAGALRVARWLRPRTPRVACVLQPPDAAFAGAIRRSWRAARRGNGRFALLAGDPVLAGSIAAGLEDASDTAPGADPAEAILAPDPAASPTLPAPLRGQGGEVERARQRQTLRQRWGSDQRPAGEFVVALLGEPPEAADSRHGLLTIGLVREALAAHTDAPPDLALLVLPGQGHRIRAQSTVRQIDTRVRLIQEPSLDAPWRILPGCDAALSLDPRGSGLPVAAAMAAGVPCVTPDTARHRLRLCDGVTALLAGTAQPRSLATRLQRLVTEPDLAGRLATAAEAHARAADLTGWLEALEAATARVAPTPAPTPAARRPAGPRLERSTATALGAGGE